MALITCPDCGTQASDQAPACPRCARPFHVGPGAWQPPPHGGAQKSGMGVGIIIVIVVAVLIIPIVGVLAVLGVYGTRKYIANAKTAEARNTLGQLAKDAIVAYEGDALAADGTVKRRICPSASAPVPADRNLVSARKYQSSAAEWQTDVGTNAGFACLKFEMSAPQYFQYEYEATPTGFVARAHGDLNGDGVFSTFEVKGQLVGERMVLSPTLLEISPWE